MSTGTAHSLRCYPSLVFRNNKDNLIYTAAWLCPKKSSLNSTEKWKKSAQDIVEINSYVQAYYFSILIPHTCKRTHVVVQKNIMSSGISHAAALHV